MLFLFSVLNCIKGCCGGSLGVLDVGGGLVASWARWLTLDGVTMARIPLVCLHLNSVALFTLNGSSHIWARIYDFVFVDWPAIGIFLCC